MSDEKNNDDETSSCGLMGYYEGIFEDPIKLSKCRNLLPPEIISYFDLQRAVMDEGIPKKTYRDLVSIRTANSVKERKNNGIEPQLQAELIDILKNRDTATKKTSVYTAITVTKNRLMPRYTEAELTSEFLEALKAEGHQVSGRMHCELGGKIDAFVYETESQPAKIIELKLKADFNSITCAMGQLLAYGDSFPDAELYFGTNCDVSNEFKELLSRYNIKTVKLADGKLEW